MSRTFLRGAVAAILVCSIPSRPAVACGMFWKGFAIELGVTTFYVDDRSSAPPIPGSVLGDGTWIYEESNGTQGLQRGGEQWLLHAIGLGDLDEDPCRDSATPDKLWY